MALGIKEFKGWAQGFTPPDTRPIYEWAADYLTLPGSYAVSGRFDVSLSRPMIAVFDDIQNDSINRIHFRKPPRYGGSLIVDIAIPWIAINDPGPIMWNWQSDDDARGHMKEKAWPLWNSCEPFRAMCSGLGKHDVTTSAIYLGQFFILCHGANINNFQGKGVRWLFNDEIWLKVWQDLYGQAVYRTRDYEKAGHYKIMNVSQAGNVGDIEDRQFWAGQKAIWGYLGNDGKHHKLELGGKRDDKTRWGLIWDEGAKRKDGTWNKARAIETARYVCKDTGQEWLDSEATRSEWNRDGAYIPQRGDNAPNARSYSVNGLLNRTFASIIDEKIDAMELASRGDMSAMRDFKQKTECLPWEETHLVVNLSDNTSAYTYADYEDGQVLEGEKCRCMTIDRQHGIAGDIPHRWVEIRSWQPGGASRQLFFGRVNTKESCREIQLRYRVPDRYVWQDAKFEKHEVFKECAEYKWTAFFGSNTKTWAHYVRIPGQPEPIKYTLPYSPIALAEVPGTNFKCAYLSANEDYFADILANLVAGRGVLWESPKDVSPEYQKHLQAEHKVEKKPGEWSWQKLHSTKPNHGWDTSKMAVAFACVLKLLSLPGIGGARTEQQVQEVPGGQPV